MSCALLFRSHCRLHQVGGGGGKGICETIHYGISDSTVVSKAVNIMNEIKDVSSSKPLQHYIVLI